MYEVSFDPRGAAVRDVGPAAPGLAAPSFRRYWYFVKMTSFGAAQESVARALPGFAVKPVGLAGGVSWSVSDERDPLPVGPAGRERPTEFFADGNPGAADSETSAVHGQRQRAERGLGLGAGQAGEFSG